MGTIGFYLDKKVMDLPNTSPDITEIYDMIVTAYNNGYKYMVLEISSHGLAMNRCEGLMFDYAIFTNLTQDHLDYHKTMGNYALAKQKLFYKLKPNDKYKEYFLLDDKENITYGFSGGDYQVVSYDMNHGGSKFLYHYQDESHTIVSPLLGKYNIYNVLTTVVVLSQLGFSQETIHDVIIHLKSPAGRMDMPQRHIVKPIMMNIVTSLSKFTIVTNDDPHDEDPNQIVEDMLDGIERDNYEVCLDRKEAIIKGINLLKDKDTLLILGKGHEEVMIVKNNERIPFNDRKVVINYLESITERIN